MWARLTKHWFLIALVICFTTGYLASELLQPALQRRILRDLIVFAVMWAMGVTLKADTIRKSVAYPWPALLAIGINIVVVPLACLPWVWVLPDRLFGGLFVAAIVPCTLASASVWTRKAGGDDSIAMMTTVVTNLACLVVVPLGLFLMLSTTAGGMSAPQQMKKLAIIVVAPLILAQLMRRFGVANWADRNKPRLSLFGQLGILVMVVFGSAKGASAVTIAAGGQPEPIGWLAGVVMVCAAILLHLMVLYLGIALARGLRFSRPRQIAIGIAGSQKTLMVGLQIAIDCGVSVVPMLIYHLGQLVFDTIVAQRWKAASDTTMSPEKHPEEH
ncbi:MAG: bile acid:sodium symporter [Pirellulales bacterium]|nr:bile acid:sodium symporter [Pirellulales bacterium]